MFFFSAFLLKKGKRSTYIEGSAWARRSENYDSDPDGECMSVSTLLLALDLLKVSGQNLENLAPAWSESVKPAIQPNYNDEECCITLWPKLILPRPGTYTRSIFLSSIHCTWFLRTPNARGNKCLSVKESGKQNNKGGRDLKKFFCCPTPNWEELGASSYSQLFLVHLALIRCRAGTQHPVALLWLGGVKFYKLADFSF